MITGTAVGRAGGAAQLRKTSNGQSVASFSLATDRFKKDAEPVWVKVSIWGQQAESLAQYITKGKIVAVSGAIDLNTYSGKNGEVTEITLNANNVRLLGGGEAREDAPAEEPETQEAEEEIAF
jgi:single-strand DNA-binding protein